MTNLLHSKYRSTASCESQFGVISSPFLLAATINHHLKTQESLVAEVIRRDLYVDNLITGAASSSSAVSFYKNTKVLFAIASMNIRCWNSNSDLRKMKPTTSQHPHIGDVVQVYDETFRGSWKVGRITRVLMSQDGKVRAAEVQLANGHIIDRPTSKLYPLESSTPPTTAKPESDRRQSTRLAAIRARERLASPSLKFSINSLFSISFFSPLQNFHHMSFPLSI